MLAAAIRAASTPVIHQQVVRHLDYLTGLENIPRTGPVVIVANHSSYADHFMTLTLLHALRPGQVWYPTKAEAFETFGSRVWHESMNCFSVQRDAPSDAIFIKAKEVLDAGNILVLYPEGTRGPGDQLLPFKSGAFRMALASGAPVVPIGMWNLHRVLPKGSSRVTNEVAAVAIGSALHITQAEPREAITTMRHDAQRAIEALILQARSATAADRAQAAIHIADLMGQIVLENLDARGNLPAEVRQRLMLLHSMGRAISRRNEASLQIQHARLGGFKALSARHPVPRLARAALVNRRATRLAQENTSDSFASYLAAQSNLATPRWAGGGHERARPLFENAAQDPELASKACVGLGEAFTKGGQHDQARAAWSRSLTSIDPQDPRGGARRAKVERLLAQDQTAS